MAQEPTTLPPGELPNVFDTDPPPLHPATIVGDGFVGVDEDWAPGAPDLVDVPYVSQAGAVLSCTRGNWSGDDPTGYAYQWKLDDVSAGTDSATLTVTAGDVGKTATCVVRATNSFGTTTVPPSNAVVITDISRRAEAAADRRHPQQEHHEERHQEAPERHK